MARKGKKLEHGCLVKWRNRLTKARERGYFTEHEDKMAAEWTACAVGEAHKLNASVVKYNYDDPVDSKLRGLGLDFSDNVGYCTEGNNPIKEDFNRVERCLNKIEKRLEKLYTLY